VADDSDLHDQARRCSRFWASVSSATCVQFMGPSIPE
jgi:hypothetical protein